MNYNSFYSTILENGRARMEPLEEKHFDLLWPVAAKTEIWEFTVAKVKTREDFRRYFDEAINEKKKGTSAPYAIFDKPAGVYAGCTRYGNISFEHKRVEIGWTWYDPLFQRTGLNRACKHLLLTNGFENWDLNRIELKTSHLNLKSQNAMLAIGAVKEGTFRRHTINEDGTIRDTMYFSFIKEEWAETKAKYFQKEY